MPTWDETLHPREPNGRFGRKDGRRREEHPRKRDLTIALKRVNPAGATVGGRSGSHGSPYYLRADRDSKVLLIGDSHTWLTGADAYPNWDVDALPGRNSGGGLEMLEERIKDRHQKIVFDLATNDYRDPAALAKNLRKLKKLVGGRDLVLVNSYREPYGTEDGANESAAVDKVLRKFATNQGVELVNWKKEAEANPDYLSDDNVHYTQEGYAARAEMIRKAVHGL